MSDAADSLHRGSRCRSVDSQADPISMSEEHDEKRVNVYHVNLINGDAKLGV